METGGRMSLQEEIERDINQFFREIQNMPGQDQKKALKNLMDKYFHLTTATILFDASDYKLIKNHAGHLYTSRSWPKKMKTGFSREVEGADAVNISIVEATILHLNSKDCLKKVPKFDYEP